MRLEEVPELEGRQADLSGLRVDDVMVRPARDDDGHPLGWVAMIVLEHRHGDSTSQVVPWMLGMRPTEESARMAAVTLLKGLLKGQKKARRDFPGMTDPTVAEDRALVIGVVAGMEEEWHARRRLALPPRAPKLGTVPMTEATIEWAGQVKATRTRWGWSQAKLGAEIGTNQSRVSQFERGEAGFPDDVLAKLAEVLDLDPPAVTQQD